jgi:hypothetical protein
MTILRSIPISYLLKLKVQRGKSAPNDLNPLKLSGDVPEARSDSGKLKSPARNHVAGEL